jgi:gliding motility-associated-like protein
VSNSPNPTHIYPHPGDYVVTHATVSLGGCTDTAVSVTVHVHDTILAAFSSIPEYPANLMVPMATVRFVDETFGAVRFQWDFGDRFFGSETQPVHTYSELGQYFVTLTAWTAEGCQSRVVHGPYIVVASDLFVPNVFSPNSDGSNDFFMVNYTGSQPFSLTVYDRWGVQHFSTRDKMEPWDGTNAKGEAVSEGVYYYVLTISDRQYAGWVTLMR